jgi:SpoVK/Ycf46/Vps4 family AAA+-type ATPase
VEYQKIKFYLKNMSENISLEIKTLQDLIRKNPENHAFKIALLDELQEQKMTNELEKSVYTFLAHLKKDDPYFEQIEAYLPKKFSYNSASDFEEISLKEEVVEEKFAKEKISFDEVGGMEEVKKKIKQMIINPFKNEELYRAYNKKIGGGLLLYGPPGCGKTHIAKAIAHEIDGAFIPISLHEILNMYIGNSEKNLHEMFQKARRNTPCVLFFDEVDALSFDRAKSSGPENGVRIINQFLNELDGVEFSNDKILVIGATNLPWNIDPAFRRPGRFDHILFTPPPNAQARKTIFEIYLAEKPTEENIDIQALVKKSSGFSGADIKHVINQVAMECFDEAIENDTIVKITEKMLLKALKKNTPSTKEWFDIAQRYLDYSNTGGKYDEIKEYLERKEN